MKNTMFRLFAKALQEGVKKEPIALDRETWRGIYKLSSSHDMAHLIGYALKESGCEVDEDIKKAFEKKTDMALFRYAKISYELEAIEKTLEKAQVRFILLKGSYIRKFYKEPWMRTSGDIDILISKADVERVRSVFENELGYIYKSSWNYEHTFITPTKIEIELHHVLSDEVQAIDKVLSTVWEHSVPADGFVYQYQMSDAMFYFYHIAHMAKHFVKGGCGIRPFLDVWVLNHNLSFDKEKRYALLAEADLLQFSKGVEALAEVWFGGVAYTPLTEELERFVLSGGTYGSLQNRIAVQQVYAGSKLSYIFSRIFLPYNKIKLIYPNLEKRKWLLPFYQIKRWFRIFKKGKLKSSIYEAKKTSDLSEDEHLRVKKLLENLGFQ